MLRSCRIFKLSVWRPLRFMACQNLWYLQQHGRLRPQARRKTMAVAAMPGSPACPADQSTVPAGFWTLRRSFSALNAVSIFQIVEFRALSFESEGQEEERGLNKGKEVWKIWSHRTENVTGSLPAFLVFFFVSDEVKPVCYWRFARRTYFAGFELYKLDCEFNG